MSCVHLQKSKLCKKAWQTLNASDGDLDLCRPGAGHVCGAWQICRHELNPYACCASHPAGCDACCCLPLAAVPCCQRERACGCPGVHYVHPCGGLHCLDWVLCGGASCCACPWNHPREAAAFLSWAALCCGVLWAAAVGLSPAAAHSPLSQRPAEQPCHPRRPAGQSMCEALGHGQSQQGEGPKRQRPSEQSCHACHARTHVCWVPWHNQGRQYAEDSQSMHQSWLKTRK